LEFLKTTLTSEIKELIRFSFDVENKNMNFLEKDEEFIAAGLFDLYALKDNKEYLSSLYLLPLNMRMRNSIVKMAGIATLTSNAFKRGQGAVKTLLKNALIQMKKDGVQVSVLYPFSVNFYRKYGWEQFDEVVEHHLSPAIINKNLPSEDYQINHSKEPDDEVISYYKQYALKHYNFVQKEQIQWELELTSLGSTDITIQIVSLKKEDEIAGLFTLKYMTEEKGSTVIIGNVCYNDRDVLNAIMKFIASLSLQCSRLTIYLPKDLAIWPFLTEQPTESFLRQRSMIRVVDVMGLNGLKLSSPDLDFNLKINDNFAEWNNGIYKLTVKDGELSVEASDHADMACDINTFSSIISGHTNFAEMISMGNVQLLNGYELEKDLPKEVTLLEYRF
jgi:predicted acetyltransferase